MKLPFVTLLVPILLIAAVLPCSAAAPFVVTSFDYPGRVDTAFSGINNHGQISGQYGGPSATVGFVVSTPGQVGTTFEYPGSWVTYPRGIDDTGNVIGIAVGRAFFRASDGTFTPLLSNMCSAAISPGGQIALSGRKVIYIKAGSGYASFEVPGASDVTNAVNVTGIDEHGNIVGFYDSDHATTESFYRSNDGSYRSIYIPGSAYTQASGMNNLGQVVGFYTDGIFHHGFLWNLNGTYVTFDRPGSTSIFPKGINDHGEVVGFYYGSDGTTHGFVMSTLPEDLAQPTITSVSPNSGPPAGGAAVTITGTGFTGATAVTFAGTAVTSFAVSDATTIIATVPAGATGPASVIVTTSGGRNAANTLYEYVVPIPTLSEWGMIGLAALLVLCGYRRLRRHDGIPGAV